MLIDEKINTADSVLKGLGIGFWSIEMVGDKKPCMFVDSVVAELLCCSTDLSPEDTYDHWRRGLDDDSRSMVDASVAVMLEGGISEVQYFWNRPDGTRCEFRCGGKLDSSFTEGIRLSGTHREVTSVSHIDEDWRRRSRLLKSYFSYYSSRDALLIMLVNPESDSYVTVKGNGMIESRISLGEEGVFSGFIRRLAETFAEGSQAEGILRILDKQYMDSYFSSSPMYRIHFQSFTDGTPRWYRLTLNKQDSKDIVVSMEERTRKVSSDIINSTMSRRFVGGFIFHLKRDLVTFVKLTPFFNFLDGYGDSISIGLGVELLCPHIDKEFRDGWRRFASKGNIRAVYESRRRADFPFKAEYAGEHTWLRASLYSVDDDRCTEPTVALVFRTFSREEIDEVHQNEDVLHQKIQLEKDFGLIRGIAAQYITLKVIRTDGTIAVNYKDMDPSYGWDRRAYTNFWEAYMLMLDEHCHPDDLERLRPFGSRDYVVNLLKGRRRHLERFRFKMKDGRYVWVHLVLIRFDSELNTELTEFAYAISNVDVEVKREEAYNLAIEQARKSRSESLLKTQYVNNISHDIRTPLNAVIGYSQLLSLAGDTLTGKERMEYLNYIEGSGELLTMLVDDILSVSDIENDILRISEDETSCNLICSKAVNCCMIRVSEGVALRCTSDYDDGFLIRTDPKRVQQILINMITNSCKATTRGEIIVHCGPSAQEGYVDFEVKDTGCGVSPEKADLIFGRHVTVDNDGSSEGHGLGLDICIKVSRKLGGRIWLDRNYTGGARFVLTLPERGRNQG